jgi:hypothetical protein
VSHERLGGQQHPHFDRLVQFVRVYLVPDKADLFQLAGVPGDGFFHPVFEQPDKRDRKP